MLDGEEVAYSICTRILHGEFPLHTHKDYNHTQITHWLVVIRSDKFYNIFGQFEEKCVTMTELMKFQEV